MRNKSFATLGILALLAAASAFGQQRLTADIPFEFRVANTVMPAGHYDVNLGSNTPFLSLDCSTCRAHATAMTFGIGGGTNAPTEPRLVFNKYGDTYFLSAVWSPGRLQGSALTRSKTEREIARITLPSQTNQVIVASR